MISKIPSGWVGEDQGLWGRLKERLVEERKELIKVISSLTGGRSKGFLSKARGELAFVEFLSWYFKFEGCIDVRVHWYGRIKRKQGGDSFIEGCGDIGMVLLGMCSQGVLSEGDSTLLINVATLLLKIQNGELLE